MLRMETEYSDGVLFVRLKGLIIRKNCYKIASYINPLLKKYDIKCLVFNFSKVKKFDYAGINTIRDSRYYIKCNKGIIRAIYNECNKEVRKLLNIPNISRETDVYKLMEEIYNA